MAKRTTTGTPATAVLEAAGVAWTAHPYEHDPAAASYGLEAAQELGVEPARVLKTLLVRLDPPGAAPAGLAVGVVPVDRQLDLKAVAAAVRAKRASMAPPDVAERTTGYVVGGISPLGKSGRSRPSSTRRRWRTRRSSSPADGGGTTSSWPPPTSSASRRDHRRHRR